MTYHEDPGAFTHVYLLIVMDSDADAYRVTDDEMERPMKKLQILGTGCPSCERLADLASEAATELGIEFELEKVKEIDRIMAFDIPGTPALVVDGNLTATVPEILALVRELKPDCVYVDGAYLLGHPDKRIDKWSKISENAEWLKKECAGTLSDREGSRL